MPLPFTYWLIVQFLLDLVGISREIAVIIIYMKAEHPQNIEIKI